MSPRRSQRRYDHRLRELVRLTRDISIATRLGVPRSTAAGWLRTAPAEVVTTSSLATSESELRIELLKTRRRARKLRAMVHLLASLLRALDLDLARRRFTDRDVKVDLLRAIDRARDTLELRESLRILGLSESRYHVWKRSRAIGSAAIRPLSGKAS